MITIDGDGAAGAPLAAKNGGKTMAKYRRIVLKLSGESLAAGHGAFDEARILEVAQNIAAALADDFCRDAGNIAQQNQQDECQTRVLCGSSLVILIEVYGPGKTKANQHDRFENLCHDASPFAA